MSEVRAFALGGLPEVRPGDDLAALVAAAATAPAAALADGDVLCIAHKVVSKAEGRVVDLADIAPGHRALELARSHGKDARHIQVVLDEAPEIVRERPGVLICRTRHGFVCANAGVDASNAGGADRLVLLPVDPDTSARAIRAALRERLGVSPAIVITDSFGRAWRRGQCEVAIGLAGLTTVQSWDGQRDSDGRELRATAIAIADEAAAAADLVRAKDSREPAVVLRGLARHVTADDGPGAIDLVRSLEEDLFR
jgi:coenzyme F420-0:L-glutamate ligase/coenzyme F420-1:gamma-L-glutamate ligase